MKKVIGIIAVLIITVCNVFSFTPPTKVEASGSVVTTTQFGYPLVHPEGCVGDNSEICIVFEKHYPSPDPSDYGDWGVNSRINFFTPSIGVSVMNTSTPGTGYVDALLNEALTIPGSGPYPSPNFRTDGTTQTYTNYGN